MAELNQVVSALTQAREALRRVQAGGDFMPDVNAALAAADAALQTDELPAVVPPSYRLAPHFTLAELTVSETAARRGLDNTPGREALNSLAYTARCMEEVRTLLGGHPIIINSGYRAPAVNAAVGGVEESQHMRGEAVDFICPSFGGPQSIAIAVMNSPIEYDQLILEFGRWVHISFTRTRTPRRQAFVLDRTGRRPITF